jgi:hypothetical protein
MGLYNFQKRFVQPIQSGQKKHTIRATRRHPDKVGNIAHLYTGLRVKNAARLLGRYPIVRIEEIEIFEGCQCHKPTNPPCPLAFRVKIAGEELNGDEREKLARLDGFENFKEMQQFWKGRLPFKGQIIHWNPSKQ